MDKKEQQKLLDKISEVVSEQVDLAMDNRFKHITDEIDSINENFNKLKNEVQKTFNIIDGDLSADRTKIDKINSGFAEVKDKINLFSGRLERLEKKTGDVVHEEVKKIMEPMLKKVENLFTSKGKALYYVEEKKKGFFDRFRGNKNGQT